jgi:NADH-quinone oxidoreductase subunit K
MIIGLSHYLAVAAILFTIGVFGIFVNRIYAMFILTVAAAEAAVGLAILVTFFRNRGDIAVDDASVMKG